MREIKQVAVKILALSYYGVLGSAFSRYFSLKLAESITVNGQNLMRKIIVVFAALMFVLGMLMMSSAEISISVENSEANCCSKSRPFKEGTG